MTFTNNLKGFRIIYSESAKKDLKKLEKSIIESIVKKLNLLVSGNQGLDIKKLTAYEQSTYRLRVGNYRVLYIIHEHEIVVKVIQVDHRKDSY